ncbi:AzlD domain-containing protein [Cryobacterium sp. TMT3-29-2]|uniref:AzlD domain-containing protein n=1 Tax=Cryobacterium TaxID=69578 RepID=UPI00351907A0
MLVLAAGTYAIRLGGVGFGGFRLALRLEQWSEPAVVVLLASVATTSALYEGSDFAGWARVVGVAVAALAAAVRAPLVAVVVVAAGVTACLRALGVH